MDQTKHELFVLYYWINNNKIKKYILKNFKNKKNILFMTGAIELLVPKSMGIEIKISPIQKSRYKQKIGQWPR